MICHSNKCHRPRTSSCHKEQQGGTEKARVKQTTTTTAALSSATCNHPLLSASPRPQLVPIGPLVCPFTAPPSHHFTLPPPLTCQYDILPPWRPRYPCRTNGPRQLSHPSLHHHCYSLICTASSRPYIRSLHPLPRPSPPCQHPPPLLTSHVLGVSTRLGTPGTPCKAKDSPVHATTISGAP